jgi:glycerol-3-phosphate acyltransferase PlsY
MKSQGPGMAASNGLIVCGTSLLLAYLLGSVSPAYFLGRLLKGLDIREQGTRNAGTTNVYHTLGLAPAVVTAVFDLSKGLLAMMASSALGAPASIVHLSGLAAVIGHVFPFYLRFRGGQGVATAVAILIYEFTVFIVRGWLHPSILAVLGFVVLSFFYITRKGTVVGVIALPALGFCVLGAAPFSWHQVSLVAAIGYIFFLEILNASQEKLWQKILAKQGDTILWRIFIRPLAYVFVVYYWLTALKPALTLVGSVVLVFLLLDLARLLGVRAGSPLAKILEPVQRKIFRKEERSTFSSMTIFLLAFFLTILLFDKPTATYACAYLTFGDLSSKVFGRAFGRRKLFEKTLEGCLAHFNACLIAATVLLHFVAMPPSVVLLGSTVASLVECLPLGLDDNLTVPILSAAAMSVPALF